MKSIFSQRIDVSNFSRTNKMSIQNTFHPTDFAVEKYSVRFVCANLLADQVSGNWDDTIRTGLRLPPQ